MIALAACLCTCLPPAPRPVVIITLESITMYDAWLWDQDDAGDDYGYEYVEPLPPMPALNYYPFTEPADGDEPEDAEE